jgi:hypothetical protein
VPQSSGGRGEWPGDKSQHEQDKASARGSSAIFRNDYCSDYSRAGAT